MAKLVDVESVGSYFESLADPRHTRNRKHLLGDIIVIAMCGILCNCDGPTAIHRWAVNRADWLHTILALPNASLGCSAGSCSLSEMPPTTSGSSAAAASMIRRTTL